MITNALTAYVVTAYRWGQRNAHSYVVNAFTDLGTAKACAKEHMEYRGGKYACEVTETGSEPDAAKQVFYVESPYFGMAGDAGHFHAADMNKPCRPSRAPFTVRELQNRVGDLERELAACSSAASAQKVTAVRHLSDEQSRPYIDTARAMSVLWEPRGPVGNGRCKEHRFTATGQELLEFGERVTSASAKTT